MRHGKYPFIAAFLLPPVALYAFFVVSPYLQAMQISLTDWTGLTAARRYVGFDNFVRAWEDDRLRAAFQNNVILLLIVPAATVVLGLFLASMLNVGGRSRGGVEGVRGSAIYKVVYFFPQVLSVAIVAVLFTNVFAPSVSGGLLNNVLASVGLDSLTQPWIGLPETAFWVVLVVMVWTFTGFFVVLFSAAMQSIPRDIYEAALLDGSGRFNTLRRVTIPLLWDTIQVALVYLAIQAMETFALVNIMLGTTGGPSGAGDTLGLAMWRLAFAQSRFGYAAAIGVILTILTMVITITFMRISRRERVELA